MRPEPSATTLPANLFKGTATERYDYDDLQRLTGASRMWDGMTWQPRATPADTYAYDDLGNITSKSDYGDQYVYGSAARTNGLAGPHAVTSISMAGFPKASFQYDPNGNLVHSDGPDGRNITFDDYDRPTKVVMGGVTTIFRYAPDGSRYLQQTTTFTGTKTVYYVGKEYQRVDWSSRPTEEQVYIGPSVVMYQSGSTRTRMTATGSARWSRSPPATAAEAIADAHSFDAFGKPRGRDWQANGDKLHPRGRLRRDHRARFHRPRAPGRHVPHPHERPGIRLRTGEVLERRPSHLQPGEQPVDLPVLVHREQPPEWSGPHWILPGQRSLGHGVSHLQADPADCAGQDL